MPEKADLHLHTKASDGKYSPPELVRLCADAGLKAIAITDHDTLKGYQEARDAAVEHNIELLPGIEITCELENKERHLLAYNFDPDHPLLQELLRSQRLRRYRRASSMISKLNKLGFDISLDEVKAEAGSLNISRNHIASLMLGKGYVGHKQLVFDKYIGDKAPAYHKTKYESISEVIKLIHECGGVAILAHPGRHYNDKQLQALISSGIDGFECIHPSHNFRFQRKYKRLCETHQLLCSGGSDFHGYRMHEHGNLGIVAVDYDWVNKMKEYSAVAIH